MKKVKELTLKTDDHIKISVDHYSGGHKQLIIICPGFLMHKESKPFLKLSKKLSQEFDIIAMDFRGHGKSKGVFTFTSRENRDLRAVIEFARSKYKSIGLVGFSLGGAVAINEVARSKAIDRLMVVSAPTDFNSIENNFMTKDVIISTIKKFDWRMGHVRLGNIMLKKERPIDNIDRLSPVPVLFVHGEKDTIVTPKHSRSLYNKAREPKKIITYKNCLHAEDIFSGENFNNFVSLCVNWFRGNI